MESKLFKFKEAVPVWAKDREEEMNLWLDFVFKTKKLSDCSVCVTGSSAYNIIINGEFVSFGPARCAHGYYRVDTLPVSKYLSQEENTIVIRVAGYNVNSFYLLDQPSFLCCEILSDGKVLAATGKSGFKVYEVLEHEEKVIRYSYQRTFSEVYNLGTENVEVKDLAITEPKNFIERNCRYEKYPRQSFETIVSKGTFNYGDHKNEYKQPRHVTLVGDKSSAGGTYKGYPISEVTTDVGLVARNVDFETNNVLNIPFEPLDIKANEYVIYKMKTLMSGIMEFEVDCKTDCEIVIIFAEILKNGLVDFRRSGTRDVAIFRCKKGKQTIRTFEPYALGYISVNCTKGTFELSKARMICFTDDEYSLKLKKEDKVLQNVVDAAINTFRQNTFTLFMDCPGRERAGWLCDSFFTARVEYLLTGKSEIEHNFIENFILPEKFRYLPDGMLPMCYPSDSYNGQFIPNWAMWFVIELNEYFARTGDTELKDKAKSRVYKLLDYFKKFENKSGLLEKLESWIFIEWSECNNHVQDVNYPTNMLYSYMLKKAGELYSEKELCSKAENIKNVINNEAKIGDFYCDNSLRDECGELKLSGTITETCQYYAFFTGIADKENNENLWNIMVNKFGPERDTETVYPEVFESNAFIGDYLRLEILFNNGYYDNVVNDIKSYFAKMADLTGTLWENNTTVASCCHGFSSHVLYWLAKINYFE